MKQEKNVKNLTFGNRGSMFFIFDKLKKKLQNHHVGS